MANLTTLDRRTFLKATGLASTGLVLQATIANDVLASPHPGKAALALNVFVSIELDGKVNIIAHRSEMGQGIRTSLPQIVADEMEADWRKVTIVQAIADEKYGNQDTDGSRARFMGVILDGSSAPTAPPTVTNTTDETTMATITVPAYNVKADYRIEALCLVEIPSSDSTDTFALKLKLGSTALGTVTAFDATNDDVCWVKLEGYIDSSAELLHFLALDGRTGQAADVEAGNPQGVAGEAGASGIDEFDVVAGLLHRPGSGGTGSGDEITVIDGECVGIEIHHRSGSLGDDESLSRFGEADQTDGCDLDRDGRGWHGAGVDVDFIRSDEIGVGSGSATAPDPKFPRIAGSTVEVEPVAGGEGAGAVSGSEVPIEIDVRGGVTRAAEGASGIDLEATEDAQAAMSSIEQERARANGGVTIVGDRTREVHNLGFGAGGESDEEISVAGNIIGDVMGIGAGEG